MESPPLRKPIILRPIHYHVVKSFDINTLLKVKSKPSLKTYSKIKLIRSFSAPSLFNKNIKKKEPVWRNRGSKRHSFDPQYLASTPTAGVHTQTGSRRSTDDMISPRSKANNKDKQPAINYFKSLQEKEIKKKMRNKFAKYTKQIEKKDVVSSSTIKDISRIEAKDWLIEILGCSEKEFRLKKEIILILSETSIHGLTRNTVLLKNINTLDVVSAGEFKIYRYEDIYFEMLRSSFSKNNLNGNSMVPFQIITRKNTTSSARYVDVAYLQSLPENKHAVFQVASNFNAMEPISDEFNPSQVDFTEKYYVDFTQGPAASISTGGAAIARVHAPFADRDLPVSQWGQTKTIQLNYLENIKEHFPVINGYVRLNGDEPNFPEPHSLEYQQLMWKTVIYYHKHCQVTTGHRAQNTVEKINDFSQTVDQVLCAAININQGLNGIINRQCKNIESKCRFILELAYTATYLTAIVNQRSHIFLTLVGGGAFGNKKEWIYDAILSAHSRWGIHSSTLQQVTLVLFKSSDLYQEGLDKFTKARIPYTINFTDELPEN